MTPLSGRRALLLSVLATLLALLPSTTPFAQEVAVDRGVRAAELWCFPLADEPHQYVYVPYRARLAEDDEGRPQFSFVRYVLPGAPRAEPGAATITTAAGGGVLHLLVLYDTPPERVELAARELRRRTGDEEAVLRGPIVFADGRYALVSSILAPEEAAGAPRRALLASGRAPVLEGNRIALSFELSATDATLLLASLASATPDVSVVFDMTFSGRRDAYDAELTIDWSEVRSHRGISAGGDLWFVSADVEVLLDELMRDHAIELRTSGSDAAMEALLSHVYDKLLELMFRPVEPKRIPPDQRGGFADAVAALTSSRGGLLGRSSRLSAFVGYQLEELRSSGTSVLRFDHRAHVERHAFITFNVGDVHGRYGDDPRFFRTVNLADPTFQQRELRVAVDGALARQLGELVNSVTVTVRKQHGDGTLTVREALVDARRIGAGGPPPLVYGWRGDDDRLAWLDYEVRTSWSFQGGGSYATDWQATSAPLVDLFAPFERREIQLVGDAAALAARGVRAVTVRLTYPFFGDTRSHHVTLRTDRPAAEPSVAITLPLGEMTYTYELTWYLADGRRLSSRGEDSAGVLFVDELPE